MHDPLRASPAGASTILRATFVSSSSTRTSVPSLGVLAVLGAPLLSKVVVLLVLVRLLVRDEKLALLAVPAGLVARDADDVEVALFALGFVEDAVYCVRDG